MLSIATKNYLIYLKQLKLKIVIDQVRSRSLPVRFSRSTHLKVLGVFVGQTDKQQQATSVPIDLALD